jgi:hypothetical protein
MGPDRSEPHPVDPSVDVELEFIPTPAAAEYRRDAVARAGTEAGLIISNWSTARRSEQQASVPSLDIRLSSRIVSRDYTRGDLARAVLPQLQQFCAALRTNVPELPFGIIERVGRQTTWLGFRLVDSPDEIVRALNALLDTDLPARRKAFGWDASEGSWLTL